MENPFRRLIVNLFVERPVREKSLADLYQELRQSGQELVLALGNVPDTPENRHQLAHIVAIERWGCQRLGVALGEILLMDEADAYLSLEESAWFDLKQDFIAARARTLERMIALQQAKPPAKLRIRHNQFGPLSVKGWLYYLHEHAVLESRRIQGLEQAGDVDDE